LFTLDFKDGLLEVKGEDGFEAEFTLPKYKRFIPYIEIKG